MFACSLTLVFDSISTTPISNRAMLPKGFCPTLADCKSRSSPSGRMLGLQVQLTDFMRQVFYPSFNSMLLLYGTTFCILRIFHLQASSEGHVEWRFITFRAASHWLRHNIVLLTCSVLLCPRNAKGAKTYHGSWLLLIHIIKSVALGILNVALVLNSLYLYNT